MVSAVQCRGLIQNYGYTPTTTISARKEKENKHHDQNSKLDMLLLQVELNPRGTDRTSGDKLYSVTLVR